MVNLDEVCLTCKYPLGEHTRQKLSWQVGIGPTARRVEFWQDDICPWLHNMTQPPWDIYLFRGKDWRALSARPPHDWEVAPRRSAVIGFIKD
jgi:hypothetical protein